MSTWFDEYQEWAAGKLGGDHIDFACALGIAGEAGEVADLLKKVYCHGKELDLEKLKLELGDVLYYTAAIAHRNGFLLSDVAQGNIDKLDARYPGGFTKAAAAARADESTNIVDPMLFQRHMQAKPRSSENEGLRRPPAGDVRYKLIHRDSGEVRYGYGQTAYVACASIGWNLSEISTAFPEAEV